MEHAVDGPARRIDFVAAAEAVEVAKELVRAVDEVDDHTVLDV
jgi:hypothetical protein